MEGTRLRNICTQYLILERVKKHMINPAIYIIMFITNHEKWHLKHGRVYKANNFRTK